jgi:hypothetical protein
VLTAGFQFQKNVDWPRFQGHAPLDPPMDSELGNTRTWAYSFKADWNDVVRQATDDLAKVYRYGVRNKAFVEFSRYDHPGISVEFDFDRYTLWRDKRYVLGSLAKPDVGELKAAKGWITVFREQPNGGMYLRRNGQIIPR